MSTGKIIQIIGTVVDVEFESESMPEIFNALHTKIGDERLILEVRELEKKRDLSKETGGRDE